jgi:hypothetical protein
VVSFDPVVAVLLGDVRCGRDQFSQHPQVRTGLIGGHLDRRWSAGKGLDEELLRGGRVPLLGEQHVDDLPVLVDRPVQVPPPAGHLDVGLIDEPPVTGRVPARSSGVGEQRREPLHPPVHRHVVDLRAALGQQLLHVPIRQAVPEIPADRDRDHLRREPEPGKRRPVDVRTGSSRSTHPPSLLGLA